MVGPMSETGDDRTGLTSPGPRREPLLTSWLNVEQLALLGRYGQERPTTASEMLFSERGSATARSSSGGAVGR